MGKEKREKTLIRLEALSILTHLQEGASISRYEMKNKLRISNYKLLHDIMQPLLDKKFVSTEKEDQLGKPGEPKTMYFILDTGSDFYKQVGLKFLKQFTDIEF